MSREEVRSDAVLLPAGRRWRHARDVLLVLTARDLKAQYKRSFLGFGWALAGPLLQLFIFATIFHRALGSEIPHYAVHVYIGVLVWTWFQGSLSQGVGLITGNPALARQPGFPLALLPHVTTSVRFIHFAIALPLLAGLLWSRGLRPSAAWAALPPLVVIQYLLIVGLTYPLAALNVLFRDTQHIAGVLLQLLMFASPVFYSPATMPEAFRAWYQFNPMATLMEAWRAVLLRGAWPDFGALCPVAVAALLLVAVGRRVFIAQSHRFVEEM